MLVLMHLTVCAFEIISRFDVELSLEHINLAILQEHAEISFKFHAVMLLMTCCIAAVRLIWY